jgi:hypothetical protein
LDKRVEELEARLRDLGGKLAEVERGSKGQATRSSKSKKRRKRPGRKPGKGRFSFRLAPKAEELSGPPVEVKLPQKCSKCGGTLEEIEPQSVYRTELPPQPKPIITAYRVHRGRCRSCGWTERAQHPDIAEDQSGATAHRLGPRAWAMAHTLHYEVGISVRKVPRVLELLGGLPLTQGAITQDAQRRAQGKVGQTYEELRNKVRHRPVVYTDDTGWKVGGQRAQLMAFDTDHETLYQVREQHRNEEVRELVPSDYQGTMVSDRAPTYDAKALETVKKQKCLSHVLRSLQEVLELKEGKTRWFTKRLKELLQQALRLWKRYRKGRLSLEQYRADGAELTEQVGEHLRPRNLSDPDNQRLLDELGWQHRQGSLLRFLQDPTVEPTNNRAERALRPGVMARKLSQCSKTEGGAYAMSAFKSVILSLKKRAVDVIEGLVGLFAGQRIEALHPT